VKLTKAILIGTAREMQEMMDCEPEMDLEQDLDGLKLQMITEGKEISINDKWSANAVEVFKELGVEMPEPEEEEPDPPPAPKPEKGKKKEITHRKSATSAQEFQDRPKLRKMENGKPYLRPYALVDALEKKKWKHIDDLSADIDDLAVAHGFKSNQPQCLNLIKTMVPMLIHAGFAERKNDTYRRK